MVEDAAAEGMLGSVDFGMGAEGTGGGVDGAVPGRFADVGATVRVDFFQGGDVVYGEGVGADADDWTCECVNGLWRQGVWVREAVVGLPYVSCSLSWWRCRSPVIAWKYVDQPEILEKNGPEYLARGWNVSRYIETTTTFANVNGLPA